MTLDLDNLEKLAKEATPGSWKANGPDVDMPGAYACLGTPASHLPPLGALLPSTPQEEANASYIAALSPDVVLPLVERTKKAEADLAQARLCQKDKHVSPWVRTEEPERNVYRHSCAACGAWRGGGLLDPSKATYRRDGECDEDEDEDDEDRCEHATISRDREDRWECDDCGEKVRP